MRKSLVALVWLCVVVSGSARATLITVNHMNSLANIFDAKNLHAPQKTVTVGQQAFGIAYSADGKTALVSNHGDGTISVIDLTKNQVIRTFTAGTGIETLAYY